MLNETLISDWPDPPVAGQHSPLPGPPSAFCPGCPVPHRFVEADRNGGYTWTHDINADGSLYCHRCSPSRPCVATVVRGKSNLALVGTEGLGVPPPPRHREWMIR